MLKQMRGAGTARRLVHGARPVPDHMGDDRRAVVADHHYLHAVIQGKAFGRKHLGVGRNGKGKCDGRGQGYGANTRVNGQRHANLKSKGSKKNCPML
jgi:hypothetical protein